MKREKIIIKETKEFLEDYNTFYESWINRDFDLKAFYEQRDKKVNDFAKNLFSKLKEDD